MNPQKLKFANEALTIVNDICKVVYNLQSNNDMEKVFGVTHDQLAAVIQKIVDALPDNFFEQTTKKMEEIKYIFAREFIFFQVQEKCTAPEYEDDLRNFIYAFSRDIKNKLLTLATKGGK